MAGAPEGQDGARSMGWEWRQKQGVVLGRECVYQYMHACVHVCGTEQVSTYVQPVSMFVHAFIHRACTRVSTWAHVCACVKATLSVPGAWPEFSGTDCTTITPWAAGSPAQKAVLPCTGWPPGWTGRGLCGNHASLTAEKRTREPASCLLEAGPRRWQRVLSLMFGPGEPDSPSRRGSPVWIKK